MYHEKKRGTDLGYIRHKSRHWARPDPFSPQPYWRDLEDSRIDDSEELEPVDEPLSTGKF